MLEQRPHKPHKRILALAFIDALMIPLPSYNGRDAHHPRDSQLATEMRVLITSPEMAIENEAERHDGPRDLGTYG